MTSTPSRLRPLSLTLLAVVLTAGCSLIGPSSASDRAAPLARDASSRLRPSPWRTPRSRLPNRLQLHDDDLRLPGAHLNSRGVLRALVFPVSFGERAPAWTDTLIARHVFGTPDRAAVSSPRGVARRLAHASDRLFRLDASVFPHLVDLDSLAASAGPNALDRDYLRHILRAWATRVDLAPFDNDGPDGTPMSSDDDGTVDLILLAVETEGRHYLRTVPMMDLLLPVGPEGKQSLRVSEVHLLGLPRDWADTPDRIDRGPTRLMLRAMGLADREMFFPDDYPRPLSTLSRLRLGWNFASFADHSGHYELDDRHTLVVPIVDVDAHRGLWLVERDFSHLFLTRVARRTSGHFDTVVTHHMQYGDDARVIPLTETEGTDGPRLRVRWPDGDLAPSISVSLSARAAEAGMDRLPGDSTP